jgi:hypothetical protein
MERQKLKDLGLTDEQVNEVMKLNGFDVNERLSKADSEALKTKVTDLTATVGERDKQLEALKSQTTDNTALQATISKLQTDNAAAEKSHAEKLAELERDYALKDALKTQGARDVLSVLPHIDGKAIIFKDGKFTGLEEQVKTLKTSKAFLFDDGGVNQGTGGAPQTPPLGGTDGLVSFADAFKFNGMPEKPKT